MLVGHAPSTLWERPRGPTPPSPLGRAAPVNLGEPLEVYVIRDCVSWTYHSVFLGR
jgi:hypothetical protein